MFEILLTSQNKFGVLMQSCNFCIEAEKPKKIQIDETSDINFEFYFFDVPSFLYPVRLQFDGIRWVSVSKFVSLTKLTDEKYLCQITKNCAQNIPKKVKKVAIDGNIFNFYDNGIVEIETESSLKFCENFDTEIINANVLSLSKGYYAINLFSLQNTEKTIVINSSFASVMSFENAICEKTENGFKVLQELFDIAHHGLVEVFEFADDIKKVDEYTVYLKNRPLNNYSPQVLPIYFLQCVKANDFSEAKNCLADGIRQKVTNQGLKTYFGNFVDILTFENKFYLKYSTSQVQNYVSKKCNFELSSGKISKIDLL